MWLQVPEESFDTAIVQMNKPQFLEVAKALEKGKLYSTKIILSFSKFKFENHFCNAHLNIFQHFQSF